MTRDTVIKTTIDQDLCKRVVVLSDSDWASSRTDYKSTSGCYATFAGMKVFAASNTQAGLPALSSGEAEVRALTRASTEGVYLRRSWQRQVF